jgi:hypothetical protein
MADQNDRYRLQDKMQSAQMLSGAIAIGLAVVGWVGLFQPSSLAKTLGLTSLLSGATAYGLTRLTHGVYVDCAYGYVSQVSDRHAVAIGSELAKRQRLEEQIVGVKVDLKQSVQLLDAQRQAKTLAENRLQGAIKMLQEKLDQLVEENQDLSGALERSAEQIEKLLDAQGQFIAGMKATCIESLNDWYGRTIDVCASFSKRYPESIHIFQSVQDELETNYTYFSAEITKISTQSGLTESVDDLISTLHSIYNHYSLSRTKLIRSVSVFEKRKLQETVAVLEQENEDLNSQDVVPREKLAVLLGNYQQRLKEFQVEYSQHTQQTVQLAEQLEQEVYGQEPIFEQLHRMYEDALRQIAHLEARLQEAMRIRLFDDIGWKSESANRVLLHFSGQQIICDACPLPITERENEIDFYITPRTQLGMRMLESDIEKVAESLKIHLGVKYVKVSLAGKNIRIRLPFKERETEKAAPEDVLSRSTDLWSLYAGSEYHFVIFAATQSGKTSLADELNAMMHKRLDGRIKFKAITLKNDGNRDDEKTVRFIKPKFMPDYGQYMEAICSVHDDLESRNQTLQINPNKTFERESYQWDEYGEFYRLSSEDEKKSGKKAVISLLQTGAGLSSETGMGMSLTLIAQNPYVSTLGLLRPDLANACIIIVGDKNVRLFLNSKVDNHGLDEDDIDRLKHELTIFKEASRKASEKAKRNALEQGIDAAIAIRRCPENYYSLIVPSKAGLQPIILYNPVPGQYTNGLVTAKREKEKIPIPTCKTCGTTNVQKFGQQGNRYKCLNPDCNTQTFTWKGLQPDFTGLTGKT